MNRLLAFAVVAAIGNSSVAFAGEPILASAARLVRETAEASREKARVRTGDPIVSFATAAGVRAAAPAGVLAQQGGTIAATGMSKRTKAMIYIGVAAAFAGTAYAIDHKVRDVTPSTLGTRQD
jgi:hypothetical protein